jgi:hypothetical protein
VQSTVSPEDFRIAPVPQTKPPAAPP